MLQKIGISIPIDLIIKALTELPSDNFRYTINEPTGDFFYNPWRIKEDFKKTAWADILLSLSFPVGEARIIILEPGNTYQVHADIDDRYHLNLQSESSYLIDLEKEELHKLNLDGIWYLMDAGRLHTATNFGRSFRIQLVVRKLLNKSELKTPVKIRITSTGLSKDDARFLFDNTLSSWLNYANKKMLINNFKFSENEVTFQLEKTAIDDIRGKIIKGFRLEIL